MKISLPIYKIEAHEDTIKERIDELIQKCEQQQLHLVSRFIVSSIKGRGQAISGEVIYDIETILDVDALRNFLIK